MYLKGALFILSVFLLKINNSISQVNNYSIDTRLIGHFYFYKGDYSTALKYYLQSQPRNTFEYNLEIESLIYQRDTVAINSNLLEMAKRGLDTTLIFNNKVIKNYLEETNLMFEFRKIYFKQTPNSLYLEFYHLLMTDQMIRSFYLPIEEWAKIDTLYIFPRLMNCLERLIKDESVNSDYINGLELLLIHQVRYENNYLILKPYLEELLQKKFISPYEYASIIDQYLVYNNNEVQKYGTFLTPMGRTVQMKVQDEVNLDNIRAELGLPPLSMEFKFGYQKLSLPSWYHSKD